MFLRQYTMVMHEKDVVRPEQNKQHTIIQALTVQAAKHASAIDPAGCQENLPVIEHTAHGPVRHVSVPYPYFRVA